MIRSALLVAMLFFTMPLFAQTAPASHTFSLNTTALSLPGAGSTLAAMDAGLTFGVTSNLELRDDNFVTTDNTFRFFGGGVNYYLPVLSTKLNNMSPNLNGYRFRFYLTGQAGADQYANKQHYAYRAGGGFYYDLTASGTWTFGAEATYDHFTGFKTNTWSVAVGPSIHF